MIKDEIQVFRMVWHPFHFEGTSLKTSAFDRADLVPELDQQGAHRYVSVDRGDIIQRESVDWRIEWQQRDGKAETKSRHDAKFVHFLCESLRACVDDEDRRPFNITSEPEEAGIDGSPENPAHCALRNVSGKTGSRSEMRAYVEQLRVMLIQLKKGVLSYAEMFPKKAA